MSLQKDPTPNDHLDTALHHSSDSSTSLTEARAISLPNLQPPKTVDGENTNEDSVEPISIGTEDAQPSPTYVQGWRLHMLTLGYQHL